MISIMIFQVGILVFDVKLQHVVWISRQAYLARTGGAWWGREKDMVFAKRMAPAQSIWNA